MPTTDQTSAEACVRELAHRYESFMAMMLGVVELVKTRLVQEAITMREVSQGGGFQGVRPEELRAATTEALDELAETLEKVTKSVRELKGAIERGEM